MRQEAPLGAMDEIEVRRKHPLWIRWTHWINFPLLALMIVSGLEVYWANDVYTPFIPDGAYHWLGLDYRLAYGMALHFAVMWIFVANGMAYVLYLLFSGEWRELIPGRASVREAVLVLLHDIGLRKALPAQGKFNAAQRIAYSAVLAMGAAAVGSGLAIYKPIQLAWLTAAFGGYEGARLIHFLCAAGLVAFFLIHIVQVIRAGWNGFQAMITGWEMGHGREDE